MEQRQKEKAASASEVSSPTRKQPSKSFSDKFVVKDLSGLLEKSMSPRNDLQVETNLN